MNEEHRKYRYEGPVLYFGKCVANYWKSETTAPSEKKARSNLAYQAKQQLRLVANTNVQLPGKIEPV